MAYAGLFEATGRPRRAIEQWDRVAATLEPWTVAKNCSSEVIPFLLKARHRSAADASKLGDHRDAARRLAATLDHCEPRWRPGVRLVVAVELLAAGDYPGVRVQLVQAATDAKAAMSR